MVKSATVTRIIPDHELWSLLDRARFAVSRLRELELSQFGLTIEQSSILYILKNRKGKLTTRELEDITLRQHHSISALINRMSKMGLLTRERSERGKHLTIVMTKGGHTLYRKVPIASLEMTFSVLAELEKRQLAVSLSLLLDNARDLLGISHRPPFLQNIISSNAVDIVEKKKRSAEPFPDHELWALLDRAAFAVSRLRELELAQVGLTKEQASILYFLRNRSSPATTRELEDFTMRQQCSISTLISRMSKMDLVSRKKSEGEKRYNISITGAGQSLYRDVPIASLGLAFSTLPGRDRQKLARMLRSLLEKARDLLGISYRPPFLKGLDCRGGA